MASAQRIRLVIHCDEGGRVVRADGEGRALLNARGDTDLLPLLVDSSSASKCERFLQRVRAGGAYGWELQLATADGPEALLFAGLRSRDELLIAAAETPDALLSVLDECVDDARSETKNQPAPRHPPQARHPSAIDEVSRVNNELVSLQRELAKRNAELTAVTIQRNELLAVAAHDLRNPILVVQGYCDLLGRASGPEESQQRVLIEQVQRASELMLHVIEDTLEYARLETGKGRSCRGEVDLAEVVQRTCESYGALAARKSIDLVVTCVQRMPRLVLDATHMEQIVGNLLSNAIKFSHRGGRVEVELGESGTDVVLTVSDRGQGIAEAELPLLFRPFQTTSARPTAGEPSTGLGLAIVRKLIEANGGTISVRSSLHQGSTFEVRFPSSAHASRLTHSSAPAMHVSRTRGRTQN